MNYKLRKRFFASLLAALLLGFSVLPAFPASAEDVSSRTHNWWDGFILSNMQSAENIPLFGSLLGRLNSAFSGEACAASEDHLHHGTSGISREGGTDPQYGSYVWARCKYCNDEFKAYSADFESAYTEYTTNIQNTYNTTNINMDGTSRQYFGGWTYGAPVKDCVIVETKSDHPYVLGRANSVDFINYMGTGHMVSKSMTVPVSGNYKLVIPPPDGNIKIAFDGRNGLISHTFVFQNPSYLFYYNFIPTSVTQSYLDNGFVETIGLVSNKNFHMSLDLVMDAPDTRNLYALSVPAPYIEGVQLFPSSAPERGSGTRVGSIAANFGYINNGTIVNVDNVKIVDETNNIYFNPATGTSSPVTNWNYDYSDRSYNLTLAGGTTTNITYGDENVVIKEGDTVYNIYYMAPEPKPEPTPEPTPEPSPPPSGPVDPTPEPSAPVDPEEPSDGGILGLLKRILDAIVGWVQALLDGLTKLLTSLFVPSEESVTKLHDAVGEKLPLISDLQDFGDSFADTLQNPERAARSTNHFTSIVDVSGKNGVSYGDAQFDVLDVSWYLEYKPMGDDIIEGVVWLVFLWNLYGALPRIIHGGASGLYSTGQIEKWKDAHKP